MFDVSNVGLGARLAIGCGGRAPVCVGCRPGCGDLPCIGLFRLHHEAAVELVFREEQQALARVAVCGLDLPHDGSGPCPADLQDAIARRRGDMPRARSSVIQSCVAAPPFHYACCHSGGRVLV